MWERLIGAYYHQVPSHTIMEDLYSIHRELTVMVDSSVLVDPLLEDLLHTVSTLKCKLWCTLFAVDSTLSMSRCGKG